MTRQIYPLNALRAFEAAGRHLSFVKAAEELYVTPAAISHQVKRLEEYLGAQLFRRLPHGLLLTETSERFLPELRKVFLRLERSVEAATKTDPELARPVSERRNLDPLTPQGQPAANFIDRPSIAVLAFTNLSGDPDQEYFSDGITEDIITELARIHSLTVMARHSSFTYKGKSVTAQQVGHELSVAYVVEGSIQKTADRVRVSAQLIDAETGTQLWSERYDRELQDIFAIQDQIAQSIAATLAQRLEGIGLETARRKGTGDLTAYDFFLRGRAHFLAMSKQGSREGRRNFERAIELDANYAGVYPNLAWIHIDDFTLWWCADPLEALERGLSFAQKGVTLDNSNSYAHAVLACVCVYKRQYERAKREFDKALTLNPSDPDTLVLRALLLRSTGRAQDAVESVEKGLGLNPFAPDWHLWDLGIAYYAAQRYEEAVAAFHELESPLFVVHGLLAGSYAALGRDDEARSALEIFHASAQAEMAAYPGDDPDAWRAYWASGFPYENRADFDRFLEGLRKAGLPLS